MNSENNQLKLQAKAETLLVEDLIGEVKSGKVRVPHFQRGLRWKAADVVALFDSIYKGYPIGSLLLSRSEGKSEEVRIGPLSIQAPALSSALWVVDGQQRITALTAVLARPVPIVSAPDDPWIVYFDARNQTFKSPPKDDRIPVNWVPVAELLDEGKLTEWVYNWENSRDIEARTAVFEAGKRIRSYRIPIYIVESSDEKVLRDIFYRVNNYGVGLKWAEIHDAVFGNKGSEKISTLGQLAENLQNMEMGIWEEQSLLRCLLAFKGLDVTRSFVEHYQKDDSVLEDAVSDAIPTLRGVLRFLRDSAEIPHLRLLPKSTPLPVLTRFFALHSKPKPRTVSLLVRWTWRTLLGESLLDERTLLRQAIAAIERNDEEGSVQSLLKLVSKEKSKKFSLPAAFDARSSANRIVLACLASLNPRDLLDGNKIEVAKLIEEYDIGAFRKIFPTVNGLGKSPANRILSAGGPSARRDLMICIESSDRNPNLIEILESHAISVEAQTAFENDRIDEFLEIRKRFIENAIERFEDRLAAWGKSDRPTIDYLLERTDG